MVRHVPWEVWDCTCSEARVFWGLLLCAWTVHTYLKCLHLVASEKYDVHTGSYWTMQFISFVKVVSVAYINKAKKQAELKSTIQWNEPLSEARLEYEWWTRLTSCYFRGTASALFGGLRQTTPVALHPPPPTHPLSGGTGELHLYLLNQYGSPMWKLNFAFGSRYCILNAVTQNFH